MMLNKLEEEKASESAAGANSAARNSLKDRFKMVRMREEAGITTIGEEDEDSNGSARGSTMAGLASPGSVAGDDRDSASFIERPITSPIPSSPNATLAPGTVSGVLAGPSAISDLPVDWDLWQAVVYEGPAAVARTSPEELNKAIATGIPNPVRGVIWQVLAQSKNEDLEMVYKSLVVRGATKKDRSSSGTSLSSSSNGSRSIHNESVASSSSSVKSDKLGANGASSPAPTNEKPNEAVLKAQAQAIAEKLKREKEDSAMLLKLEKTIRRDLGARTSYSKHAAAAGLQDALFGVCKAYALFDEGVGYAQGMNFLVMPILFNVRIKRVDRFSSR
jgi:hypothetical protein